MTFGAWNADATGYPVVDSIERIAYSCLRDVELEFQRNSARARPHDRIGLNARLNRIQLVVHNAVIGVLNFVVLCSHAAPMVSISSTTNRITGIMPVHAAFEALLGVLRQ